ncbi:YggT family protein [Sinobacterium caligoides]|uniref:YggT family protein n=1 Tax=Sinobacterium caligoides TaxID=933926 RepID=A0A3N2DGQ8_9GAMM|nr:YggT family protein [Sinobacterium caligoides]ROR98931.1 YggT family protein [Sinobacterium caligoides]
MGALAEVLSYLITTLVSFYLILVILRFLLQLARADFYNPISQFIVKATNPPLKPMRRIIPSIAGLDTASLVLALLVQAAGIALLLFISYRVIVNPTSLLIWSLLGLATAFTKLFFFTIIATIVCSWLAPQSRHPALMLLHQINEPVMAPFRRLLPSMGGLDLSPILVFMVIHVLEILIHNGAHASGMPTGIVIGLN